MHGIPHIFNMSYINFLHKLQLQRTINKYIINNIYSVDSVRFFKCKNLCRHGENMQETNELLNKLKDKTGKFNRAMATL